MKDPSSGLGGARTTFRKLCLLLYPKLRLPFKAVSFEAGCFPAPVALFLVDRVGGFRYTRDGFGVVGS